MRWNLKDEIQEKITTQALKQFGRNLVLALAIAGLILSIFFLVFQIGTAFPDYIPPQGATELLKILIEVSGILIGFSGVVYAQLFSSLSNQQNVLFARILEITKKSDGLKAYLEEYDMKWQRLALAAVGTFALLLLSILSLIISLTYVSSLDPANDTIAPFGLSFFPLFFIISAVILVIFALSYLSLKPPLDIDGDKKEVVVNSKKPEGKMNSGKNLNQDKSSEKQGKITKKGLFAFFIILILATTSVIAVFYWATNSAFTEGQMATWDMISDTEKNLCDLYSNSTQTELREWLPDNQMNFTEGLIWESELLNYDQSRPKYQNVTQVLKNGKGACGEFVWVFGAFCVANDIPFRVVGVGYFVPNVVDHSWVQVNPSSDGETWIHVEVTDTCIALQNGKTIADLWNATINNNTYYVSRNYKMVLAYEMNQDGEVVITDVTAMFSQS